MLKLALPIILAVGAGISIVIQQVLNANLRSALNSAAWYRPHLHGSACAVAGVILIRM